MTQKELLYYEDAIGHESNIISILNNSIQELDNDEIKNYLENEVLIHQELKNNLINCLKENVNG